MTIGWPKTINGATVYPEYIRGHHPGSRKNQTGNKPPWNKGLTKDHPIVAKICFQPGHEPHNNWDKVNEKLRTDPDLKARWLESKRGQTAWNKGLTKDQYPNGIVSGPDHGNWKSNASRIRDLAEYKSLRPIVLKRDDYTCQNCKKRGGELHVHHIVPFAEDESLGKDIDNLTTLCVTCHHDIHFPNRSQGGN